MSTTENMRPNANLGPYLEKPTFYIFGDTANKNSCFIMSHGGHKFIMNCNRRFKVPADTTVQFFLDHNEAMVFPIGAFNRVKMPKIRDTPEKKTFHAGETCTNYILTKFQDSTGTSDGGHSYADLQNVAREKNLLFVTLRHRRFHAARTLENIVTEVKAALPQIKTFYCIHCRVEPGYTVQYNAEYGGETRRKK